VTHRTPVLGGVPDDVSAWDGAGSARRGRPDADELVDTVAGWCRFRRPGCAGFGGPAVPVSAESASVWWRKPGLAGFS
jgi:hypothetical protein